MKEQRGQRPSAPGRQKRNAGLVLLGVLWLALGVAVTGCLPPESESTGYRGPRGHQGPGHRPQSLALTPAQELSLGRQAYAEVLKKAGNKVLPKSDPRVRRVREVGQRIAKAAAIEPLQREINLDVRDYQFEWAFNVIDDPQVNAFCLPAGKVAVFSGLLRVATTDDELATVMGHEAAHALAHHASERLAREQMFSRALTAVVGGLGKLSPRERERLIGLLSGGAQLYTRAYDRREESEADHIGIFLMTFARYDPEQAVAFWKKMERLSARNRQPPPLLSTHPSDAQRIHDLQHWVPFAQKAYEAYQAGNILPPGGPR
jgi:predicted Zn-dependent protease